jgi:hypothetical protein
VRFFASATLLAASSVSTGAGPDEERAAMLRGLAAQIGCHHIRLPLKAQMPLMLGGELLDCQDALANHACPRGPLTASCVGTLEHLTRA